MSINTERSSDDNYARIALNGPSCSFLNEGLCSIQKKLGEGRLPIMCSMYPRVMNVVDDVLQRSLDLSCPEAARMVLLSPEPMQFDEEEGVPRDPRLGNLSVLKTSDETSGKPYRYFREIRALVIWLLQNRAYSLWKRLAILGSLCDQLNTMTEHQQIPEVLAAYRDGVERGTFEQSLDSHRAEPDKQLELVLELIVGRVSSDFTMPRMLACYQKFRDSMEWTADMSMLELGRRYAAAHAQYYAPFLARHGHMLENYLVSYVYRTLFPLGAQESTHGLSIHRVANTIRDQCLLMMVYFGIAQTLLIGMAASSKGSFSTADAVYVIQAFTKAFGHSPSFPERALEILSQKGVTSCTMMAILLLN